MAEQKLFEVEKLLIQLENEKDVGINIIYF